MLLTFAALAGVAYWGHHTEWTFSTAHRGGAKPSQAAKIEDLLTTESGSASPSKWCEQHGIAACPLCDRSLAQVLKPLEPASAEELERVQKAFAVRDRHENDPHFLASGLRVRAASKEAVEKLGIDVAPVWEAAMTESITASGEVSFDATKVARLAARVPGTAWRVTKQIGDPVKAGELLAIIDAAEVGKAKTEFLHGIVQVRLKTQALANLKNALVPERQKKEAEAARRDAEVRLLSAEQALVNLGLSVKAAEFGKLEVDDIAKQLQRLGLSRELSKTAAALGVGRIVLREEPHAITVPNEAVQTVGGCEIVFVRDKDFLKPNGPKVFHARMVRTGAKDITNTEIIVGVAPGEVVVSKGSALLADDLKRNQSVSVASHRQSERRTPIATNRQATKKD